MIKFELSRKKTVILEKVFGIHQSELAAFPDFPDKINDDYNECDFFLMLNSEMHQYLDDLHNSVNQYFLSGFRFPVVINL